MVIYLCMALGNVTNVIVPKAFSNKTPWFGFVVRVPTLVIPLQRSQLCQLLLGEPFTNLRRVPLSALGSSLSPAWRVRSNRLQSPEGFNFCCRALCVG